MHRLNHHLRLLAVAVGSPAILAYIVLVCVCRPLAAVRMGVHLPLRIWMSVMDWVRGLPIGYSYWEQYQAPSMLDEIVVHHHDD